MGGSLVVEGEAVAVELSVVTGGSVVFAGRLVGLCACGDAVVVVAMLR